MKEVRGEGRRLKYSGHGSLMDIKSVPVSILLLGCLWFRGNIQHSLLIEAFQRAARDGESARPRRGTLRQT